MSWRKNTSEDKKVGGASKKKSRPMSPDNTTFSFHKKWKNILLVCMFLIIVYQNLNNEFISHNYSKKSEYHLNSIKSLKIRINKLETDVKHNKRAVKIKNIEIDRLNRKIKFISIKLKSKKFINYVTPDFMK